MVTPARTPLRTNRLRAVNEPQRVTVEFDESGAMTVGRSDGRQGRSYSRIVAHR